MEFGLGIPTRGPLADPASIEAIAARAEALGFSWLAVSDHLIVPRAIDSRYPYSDSGAFPGAVTGDCLEQFTLLAFLAAITARARLLTSVTVVPHRGAIETAKLVTTIDNLSGGRFAFGVGAGWRSSTAARRKASGLPFGRIPTTRTAPNNGSTASITCSRAARALSSTTSARWPTWALRKCF